MNDKSQIIKQVVTKIDTDKIASYLHNYSSSKTLKQIVSWKKRALKSNNDQEIFKLAVRLAYSLDTIVNVSKYVKDKEEKKYWLETSEELFKHTIGLK